MENIQKPEIIGPDKDVVEMTKAILRQNEKIIETNAMLAKMLANPIMYIQHETDNK